MSAVVGIKLVGLVEGTREAGLAVETTFEGSPVGVLVGHWVNPETVGTSVIGDVVVGLEDGTVGNWDGGSVMGFKVAGIIVVGVLVVGIEVGSVGLDVGI